MVPLKFKCDRQSLEVMYFSFVLPVMEYANVVWGGTYDIDLTKLERIHVDGMRLTTGATARSNIANLYKETKWQTITSRHRLSCLIMMYKIKNSLAPEYLSDLLPLENTERVRYSLRNQHDITIPFTRLESFKRSFFPSAIRMWNRLAVETRNSETLEEFKQQIKPRVEKNILYYYGKRWPCVHHSRIRIGCSKLKYDLCNNLHVINETYCECGADIEDAHHFFLKCPLYIDLRFELFNAISVYSQVNMNVILHGNSNLDYEQNKTIFDAVHSFILQTKRFIN